MIPVQCPLPRSSKRLHRNIRITTTNVKLGPPLAEEGASDAEVDEEMALEAPSSAARRGLELHPEAKAPWMIRVPTGSNRRATVDGRISAPTLR